MSFLIAPIPGFYQFAYGGAILPQWYTEYYTQEDRLKALAKINQRQNAWNERLATTLNDVIEAVNAGGSSDVSGLIKALEELQAEVALIEGIVEGLQEAQGELSTEVAEVKTNAEAALAAADEALDAAEELLAELQVVKNGQIITNNNVAALSTAVGNLQTEVSGFSTSITALQASNTALNGRVTAVETNVTNLSTQVGGFEDRIADLEAEEGGEGGDIGALTARVSTVEGEVVVLDDRTVDADGRIQNIEKRYYVDGSGLSNGESGPGTEIRYTANIAHMASDEVVSQHSTVKLLNDPEDFGGGTITISPGPSSVDAEGNNIYSIVFKVSDDFINDILDSLDSANARIGDLEDKNIFDEEANRTNEELKAAIEALEARVAALES